MGNEMLRVRCTCLQRARWQANDGNVGQMTKMVTIPECPNDPNHPMVVGRGADNRISTPFNHGETRIDPRALHVKRREHGPRGEIKKSRDTSTDSV